MIGALKASLLSGNSATAASASWTARSFSPRLSEHQRVGAAGVDTAPPLRRTLASMISRARLKAARAPASSADSAQRADQGRTPRRCSISFLASCASGKRLQHFAQLPEISAGTSDGRARERPTCSFDTSSDQARRSTDRALRCATDRSPERSIAMRALISRRPKLAGLRLERAIDRALRRRNIGAASRSSSPDFAAPTRLSDSARPPSRGSHSTPPTSPVAAESHRSTA